MFPPSIKSSKFSNEVFHAKFDFQYFVKEISTERKSGKQTLQYIYSDMSKNGENRWFGCDVLA